MTEGKWRPRNQGPFQPYLLPFATSVLWVFTSCLTLATLTPFPSHLVTRAPPGPEGVRDEEEKRMSVVKERLTITGGKGVSVERVE